MLFIIILFIYTLLLCLAYNKTLQIYSISIALLTMIKISFNYRKCTLTYIEIKLRKIKKEKSFFYNGLTKVYDLNKDNKNMIILIMCLVILLNIIKMFT